jgi:hypothetical protein
MGRRACMQGLWRGTIPGLLLTVPYTSVQFVALQQCRSFAARHGLLSGLPRCAALSCCKNCHVTFLIRTCPGSLRQHC